MKPISTMPFVSAQASTVMAPLDLQNIVEIPCAPALPFAQVHEEYEKLYGIKIDLAAEADKYSKGKSVTRGRSANNT